MPRVKPGDTYNYCKAIKQVGSKNGMAIWLWECLCKGPGCVDMFEARACNVKSGQKKSCGCHRKKVISGKIYYDSAGNPTCQALWYIDTPDKHARWLFRCLVNGPNCKYTFLTLKLHVEVGDTKSCGCLHTKTFSKHGLSGTPEYKAYHAMHQRCYNENHIHYNLYGGRGITVDWEWHKDNSDGFKNFLEYMGFIVDPNKNTIERIDNNLTYGSKNVKKGWQSRAIQARNRSSNIIQDKIEADLIRDLYKSGYSTKVLANAVGCSLINIQKLISGETWR